MNIRVRHYNDVAILTLNGRIDSSNAPQFLQVIEEQITVDYVRMVIDLKGVNFLNSTGIKVLMQSTEATRQQGGDMRLANAQKPIKSVLNLAGVDSIIQVYPNVVCATASYFSNSPLGKTKTYGFGRF